MKTLSASAEPSVRTSAARTARFVIALADDRDRDEIARLRHEVYAHELGQHAANPAGRLRDPLDDYNVMLVARADGQIAGFISVTPPGRGPFSIDKYFARGALPFVFDERTLGQGLNFTLETALGDVDLLGEIVGGGGYDALEPHSIELELYGVRCKCLDLPTLIHVKRAAGRPKDLDAVAELEEILRVGRA